MCQQAYDDDYTRFRWWNKRVLLTLIGLVVLAGPITMVQADQPASTITLDRAMHFSRSDGQDLVVAPGAYRVEAHETQLRLTPEDRPTDEKGSLLIQASSTAHEETVSVPIAMVVTEEGNDDQVHLVLLLPENTGWEAIGSMSGVTSRATSFSRLSRVQMQQAYAQQRQSVEMPNRLQPIKVAPNAGKQKRPLTGRSGPGRIVTWQFFHRHRPDIVAQALADVQAGKRPLDSVSGLASQEQLAALLKNNWTAEVARLNATRAAAAKQAGIASRVVPGMAANQSAAPKIAVPPPPVQYERLAPMARPVMLPVRDLGDIYSGETRTAEYGTYASFDGVLQCRLDPRATTNRFRVEAIRPISGVWQAGKPINPSIVSGTSFTEAQQAQKATVGFVEVSVKAFDQVGCRVFFEPDPGAGPPVGRYEATLAVDFFPFSPANRPEQYILPIRVNNLGISLDLFVHAEVGHADTLTENVVEMPIVITNAGSGSRSGPIRAEQLPPGVTMEPMPNFSFEGQGTQRHVLRFRVSKAARDGPAQPIVVSVALQRRLVHLSLTIYHPFVFWCFGSDCDFFPSTDIPGIDKAVNNTNDQKIWRISAWIRDDGSYGWDAEVGNHNVIDIGGSYYSVTVSFVDGPVANQVSENVGPGLETFHFARAHPWIRDNFLVAAERGFTVHFCCYDY